MEDCVAWGIMHMHSVGLLRQMLIGICSIGSKVHCGLRGLPEASGQAADSRYVDINAKRTIYLTNGSDLATRMGRHCQDLALQRASSSGR